MNGHCCGELGLRLADHVLRDLSHKGSQGIYLPTNVLYCWKVASVGNNSPTSLACTLTYYVYTS